MSAEKLLEFIGSSRSVDDLTLQLIKDGWQQANQPKEDVKRYTIDDIEKCVENWGMCKVEKEYIEKFLQKDEVKCSSCNKVVKEGSCMNHLCGNAYPNLSEKPQEQRVDLQELAIWMTGCGYDFTQHEYYMKNKHLLTETQQDNGLREAAEKVVDLWRNDRTHTKMWGALEELEKALKG